MSYLHFVIYLYLCRFTSVLDCRNTKKRPGLNLDAFEKGREKPSPRCCLGLPGLPLLLLRGHPATPRNKVRSAVEVTKN